MRIIGELLGHFFTHKDFLPPADQISGTLFTPLHLIFSLLCIGVVVFGILQASQKGEKTLRTLYGCLWGSGDGAGGEQDPVGDPVRQKCQL